MNDETVNAIKTFQSSSMLRKATLIQMANKIPAADVEIPDCF